MNTVDRFHRRTWHNVGATDEVIASVARELGQEFPSDYVRLIHETNGIEGFLDGEQYVIVPIGWGSLFRLFATSSMTATEKSKYGPTRLLAFKLGATRAYPGPNISTPGVPRPPQQSYSADAVKRGEEWVGVFGCTDCHSPRLEGSGRWVVDGGVPDLRYAPPDVHRDWYAILLGGSHREYGMLPFAAPMEIPPTPAMTAGQADDIRAYVIDRAWALYQLQQKAAARP